MSCYKFAPAPGGDPVSFVFPTDFGWLYILSFTHRPALLKGNPVLENSGLTFEIAFEKSPLDMPKKGTDPTVQPTILTIIQRQFESNGELPIYYFICDMVVLYYAGLFVHASHPNYAQIPDAFAQFLEEDVSSGKLVRRR